jgi:hypothetical protein
MSRAQSNQVFNTATGNSATDQGNAVGSFGTASNANNARLANPGFDPATKTAITSSGQDANNAAFDSLAQTAQAREARTRNDAGSNELADSLAMQKGQGSADAAMAAQKAIGTAALQDRSAGISEAGQLYGTSLGGANTALKTGEESASANPSFGDTFGTQFASGFGNALGRGIVPSFQKGGFGIGG